MMYQKVLVALDGSKLAESVLPHVRQIAKDGTSGEIIIIRVVNVPSVLIAEGFDLMPLKMAQLDSAKAYLTNLQSLLDSEGIKVHTDVVEGEPSHAILDYAKENNIDLIIIATHGHTGIKRVMFGSVALRILHDAHVPVLLIRPEPAGE